MLIAIKEILFFPGQIQYHLVAEIPKQESQSGIVVRNTDEGKFSMHKDSKVHPVIAKMMVQRVRDHVAQVNLD